jgi:hypothetical protein
VQGSNRRRISGARARAAVPSLLRLMIAPPYRRDGSISGGRAAPSPPHAEEAAKRPSRSTRRPPPACFATRDSHRLHLRPDPADIRRVRPLGITRATGRPGCGSARSGAPLIRDLRHVIIAGLDPAIHPLRKTFLRGTMAPADDMRSASPHQRTSRPHNVTSRAIHSSLDLYGRCDQERVGVCAKRVRAAPRLRDIVRQSDIGSWMPRTLTVVVG